MNWIKLYVDGGWDMTVEQDGVWNRLLKLSGKYGGVCGYGNVGINHEMGFHDDQLAEMIQLSRAKWDEYKAFFVSEKMLKVKPKNIINIVNWHKYQSEYGRQRKYRNQRLHGVVTTEGAGKGTHRDREGEREGEKDLSAVADLRQIVEHFKTVKGFENMNGWDKVHFKRNCRSAKQLVDFLGSAASACQCVTEVGERMDKKSLEWTLETVVKHSDVWLKSVKPKSTLTQKEIEELWAKAYAL